MGNNNDFKSDNCLDTWQKFDMHTGRWIWDTCSSSIYRNSYTQWSCQEFNQLNSSQYSYGRYQIALIHCIWLLPFCTMCINCYFINLLFILIFFSFIQSHAVYSCFISMCCFVEFRNFVKNMWYYLQYSWLHLSNKHWVSLESINLIELTYLFSWCSIYLTDELI